MPKILIFILIAFTFVFRLVFDLTYYDLHRFYLLFIFFGISVYLISDKKDYPVTKVHLFFLAIFSIGLLSSVVNGIFHLGASDVLHFSSILLIASMLSLKYSRIDLCKFLYRFSLLFVSIYIIFFLFSYTSHLSNPFSPLWPANSTFKIEGVGGIIFSETLLFSFIRFFNHIQTWTFPLLISLFIIKNERIHKLIIFILLSVWWALLIQSGGRGTFLAFSLSFFVIIILFKQNRKERFFIFASSLLCGFFLYFILFYSIADPFTAITREGTSGRIDMWHKAWLMFLSNPIFGTGPLSYSIVQDGNLYFAHPHNFYLQILSEWGIIVFIMASFLTIFGLHRKFVELKNRVNGISKELELGVFTSLIATLIHSGLSQNLHSPLSQFFLLFVLAWFFFPLNTKSYLFHLKVSKVSWLSIVLLIAFIGLNVENIAELFSGNESYLEQFQTNRFYPRIWYQGLN